MEEKSLDELFMSKREEWRLEQENMGRRSWRIARYPLSVQASIEGKRRRRYLLSCC